MNIGEIDIGTKYSKKIAMDSTAILLFQELESFDKVILDFGNVEFLSRSFAQEYVYQRYHSKVEIVEINMSDLIKGLFEVVEEDFKQTCL
ncbi:MAG: DUF4325 domain-containing protein [Methanobrevibacter sp.]|nr:DUF4325 domain-containing protein [Methanobrevibacter sp.]